jgi:hypothetical protein
MSQGGSDSEKPGWLASLLSGKRHSEEDRVVSERLRERIDELPAVRDSKEVRKAFVETEFTKRMRSYESRAKWWRVAQVGIWAAIALLGLLITILSSSQSGHVLAAVAGALVAILTTFVQAAHPGQQADAYNAARRAMRDEAWDLLNGTGDYVRMTNAELAYKEFVKKIRTYVLRKRTAAHFETP